jgi:hypothetical protein
MRGFLVLTVVALVAAAQAVAAARTPFRDAAGHKPRKLQSVRVIPQTGLPDADFIVRFRARNEARRVGRTDVFYDVEANGPEREGCDYDSAIFRHARRGSMVRIRLASGRARRNWCVGHYEGTIWLMRMTWDQDVEDTRERIVGTLSFDVTAPPAPVPRSSPPSG